MRVCLPDLADTIPAVFVGLISAPVARSADGTSDHHVVDNRLTPRSRQARASRESAKIFSSRVKPS